MTLQHTVAKLWCH